MDIWIAKMVSGYLIQNSEGFNKRYQCYFVKKGKYASQAEQNVFLNFFI